MFKNLNQHNHINTISMDSYLVLSVNMAIKTVGAHKGHRKQRMQQVEGLISLLEATPSARLTTDLQTKFENYLDKTNNIAAGLQYIMLHDNGKDRIGKYDRKREMLTMGTEDAELITMARASMASTPEPETTFLRASVQVQCKDQESTRGSSQSL